MFKKNPVFTSFYSNVLLLLFGRNLISIFWVRTAQMRGKKREKIRENLILEKLSFNFHGKGNEEENKGICVDRLRVIYFSW